MTIAFFDVDNTLIRGYSGFYTTLALIQRGVLKKRRLLQAMFYRIVGPFYRHDHDYLRKIYETAMADMVGSKFEDILEIGRVCFENSIKPRIFREGIELVESHKKKGEPVYLLTSGPFMAIHHLANFLEAAGHSGAGAVVDEGGRLTERVKLPICYREGKVEAARDLIDRLGGRWEDCYYYADSIDDIFLLEKVGHPRLVNPDRQILKIGRSRNWPVLSFTEVLGAAFPAIDRTGYER